MFIIHSRKSSHYITSPVTPVQELPGHDGSLIWIFLREEAAALISSYERVSSFVGDTYRKTLIGHRQASNI